MKKINLLYAMALVSLASCKNNDWEFPDFEFQSVYFAYQTPVRTVTLGEDIFDNSLDNQHKVKVMATTGGVYNNAK
ncbi:MAG: adhesin, partial [Sphingobacterium paramultivorum]